MSLVTENPADCEICGMIHFLRAKGAKVTEIHNEISKVYGENIMSDGMVGNGIEFLKMAIVHGVGLSGRP